MNNFKNKRRYAGFWIRSLAVCIDYTIIAMPLSLLVVSYIFLILIFEKPLFVSKSSFMPIVYFSSTIIFILYFVIFNSSKLQATIGKKVCNIFIGDSTTENKIKKTKAFGRFVFLGMVLIFNQLWRSSYADDSTSNDWVYLASVLALFLASHFLAAITERKTALHDILFKTSVFYGQPPPLRLKGNNSVKSYYMAIAILLILWGAVIPLFKLDHVILMWCFITLYISFVLIVLAYYKLRSPHIYAKYSISMAVRSLRPLFLSLIPTFVLLLLTYSIVLYIKFEMG